MLTDIPFDVFDDLMVIRIGQMRVDGGFIGDDVRTGLNVGAHHGVNVWLGAGLDYRGPYLPFALQHPQDNGLTASALCPSLPELGLDLGFVHVPDLSADKGFVHLYRAT